ncbi:unnamed protein product [Medioppia subpectinata]|uniref:Jun-like transcription factor domain-containing protein n=1 Tax=Medioppia subpectinata TaxID=1979941 RepID=A0A7R9LDY2_9ACAR|nr:unnamed protein product [Medioppia subpectinata]CAG2118008.1 unnamed protein product [Medioppia subpectinata]
MDNTFYEENQENNIKMLKNKMTLDFNSPTSHSKKSKLMKTCILESPDLKMCKLGSPELERMIIQHGMVTTTPTPSAVLPYFLKQEEQGVTEEQQEYARGFVDALNQLHLRGQQPQQQQRRNSYHMLVPAQPPSQQVVVTTAAQIAVTTAGTTHHHNRVRGSGFAPLFAGSQQ